MATRVRAGTLMDAFLPWRGGLVRDAAFVLIAGSALALFARVAIPLPFTPVPITGQTLGVLLVGALLGGRRGALAVLAYLAEGLAGLPVFAGGTSAWSPSLPGVPVIAGPTAGYLLSFPVAAYVVGRLADRGWDRRFWHAVGAMVVGDAVIYLIALPWLARFVGAGQAISLGMLPFLVGDALKVVAAAAVLPSGWRAVSVFDELGTGRKR